MSTPAEKRRRRQESVRQAPGLNIAPSQSCVLPAPAPGLFFRAEKKIAVLGGDQCR